MPEMKSLTLNDKTYVSFVDSVARSSVIVNSASGEIITVTDSSNQALMGLNIYGKSTQAGTPTPTSPVSIVSVGDDGSMAVTVGTDTMGLMLTKGLRGIPVTDKNLATYTDASGQMWCADEIDFERGVYIQRCCKATFDGTEKWDYESSYKYFILLNSVFKTSTIGSPYCSHFARGMTLEDKHFFCGSVGFGFSHTSSNLSEWKEFLSKQMANGTPVELVCSLSTPVEIPLTASEIATYKALHTNKPRTTITNDENAYMSVKYIADPKAYIDNKISGAILAATVE